MKKFLSFAFGKRPDFAHEFRKRLSRLSDGRRCWILATRKYLNRFVATWVIARGSNLFRLGFVCTNGLVTQIILKGEDSRIEFGILGKIEKYFGTRNMRSV